MSGHRFLNIRATKILLTLMPWVISDATPALDTPWTGLDTLERGGDSELRLSHAPDIVGSACRRGTVVAATTGGLALYKTYNARPICGSDVHVSGNTREVFHRARRSPAETPPKTHPTATAMRPLPNAAGESCP